MHRKLSKWFFGRLSIRNKLLISFSLLVSISILVLGVYTYTRSTESFEKTANATIENNLNTLTREMTYRFEREMDTLQYLAFNLNFRRVLERYPNDRVKIALELNDTVEPVLWYYIAGDSLIKQFEIYTESIDTDLGSFLKSAEPYLTEPWYVEHMTNFRNIWRYEDGQLSVSRTLLDTNTVSKPIGVIRINFFFSSFIEPFNTVRYLNNGLLVLSEDGDVIYHTKCGNDALDEGMLAGSSDLPGHKLMETTISTCGWRVIYYVDQQQITGELNAILKSTLLLMLGCLAVSILVSGLLATSLTRRIQRLKKYTDTVASGDLDADISTTDTDEIGALINAFGHMTVQLRETIRQTYVMRLEKRDAEMKALQAMINPHFLYNVLSSIKWRAIRNGNDDISEIAGMLAKFYRTNLNNGQQLTTVRGELENVQAYIALQQRLLDEQSFEVAYHIDPSILDASMLNFLLQPIAENAVKHGVVYCEDQTGRIEVDAHPDGRDIVFTISNNGPMMNADLLEELMTRPGKGYGIYNIRQRIEIFYGAEYGVSTDVTGGMVRFTVRIPRECSLSKST